MLSNTDTEFRFDDRIATCVFSTAGSAQFDVVRIVDRFRPQVGSIVIHYPCDGLYPIEASMQLQPSLCTFDYANELYRELLKYLAIDAEIPCRISVRSISRTEDNPPELLIASDYLRARSYRADIG